jgi:hypothetical protein
MRMMSAVIAVLLAAATLAGCGLSDPYNDSTTGLDGGSATTATTPTGTQTGPVEIQKGIGSSTPDLPGGLDRSALSSSAATAIERFVDLSGTWTWRDAVQRYRRAAGLALGSARETMLVTAVQVASDATYRVRRIRQTTHIEAIVPRAGATAERIRYLVVQRRRIELADTPPSGQWFVSLATLRRVGDRWAMAAWDALV